MTSCFAMSLLLVSALLALPGCAGTNASIDNEAEGEEEDGNDEAVDSTSQAATASTSCVLKPGRITRKGRELSFTVKRSGCLWGLHVYLIRSRPGPDNNVVSEYVPMQAGAGPLTKPFKYVCSGTGLESYRVLMQNDRNEIAPLGGPEEGWMFEKGTKWQQFYCSG